MAAKGTSFDNDLLKLIFTATAIGNIADNAASSPLTNLYVSLHTGSPAGTSQTTNEAAYGSYARVAVARSTSGFTVTSNSVSPASTITFPVATSGSETETFFGIGTSSSGTGKLLYYGPVSPTIAVSTGIQPQLLASSTVTEA